MNVNFYNDSIPESNDDCYFYHSYRKLNKNSDYDDLIREIVDMEIEFENNIGDVAATCIYGLNPHHQDILIKSWIRKEYEIDVVGDLHLKDKEIISEARASISYDLAYLVYGHPLKKPRDQEDEVGYIR